MTWYSRATVGTSTKEGNRSLAAWLAEACRGAREIAKVSQPDVARLAGVQRSGIARFEAGETWPRNPDRMVKAYAVATGYGDSRRLWRIAIGLWERYGDDPLMEDDARPPDLATALDAYLERKLAGELEAPSDSSEPPESEAA